MLDLTTAGLAYVDDEQREVKTTNDLGAVLNDCIVAAGTNWLTQERTEPA